MLDDAVFAGRVHALEHDQHRPAAMGVEALLHILQARDAVGENRPHPFDVGRETKAFGRIEVGKLELVRLVDPAMFDDLGELHRQCLRLLMLKLFVPWIDELTIPAAPCTCAGAGPNLAVNSSPVKPAGSSFGSKSVAMSTNE